jgi:hypothetical protein
MNGENMAYVNKRGGPDKRAEYYYKFGFIIVFFKQD